MDIQKPETLNKGKIYRIQVVDGYTNFYRDLKELEFRREWGGDAELVLRSGRLGIYLETLERNGVFYKFLVGEKIGWVSGYGISLTKVQEGEEGYHG